MPNLISRRQFNDRKKQTANLCEEIRKRIAKEIDGGEDYFCITNRSMSCCPWKPLQDGAYRRVCTSTRLWLLCLARRVLLRLQTPCTLWPEWCHTLIRLVKGKCPRHTLFERTSSGRTRGSPVPRSGYMIRHWERNPSCAA